MSSVGVILGSAFHTLAPEKVGFEAIEVATPWGNQEVFRFRRRDGDEAFAIFRHGVPHTLLPNQINYRAQAWALRELGCGALLVTSSVGVLDPELPLYEPMLVTDLLMTENRLPDGSTCTVFTGPRPGQGHLVLGEGLFSRALGRQIQELAPNLVRGMDEELVFVYSGGPRGKTPAENRFWAEQGGQVNSMTLGPEVVLANELEIPSAAMVVGHKYSVPRRDNPEGDTLGQTLESARQATQQIVLAFLEKGRPVRFGNSLFRFD